MLLLFFGGGSVGRASDSRFGDPPRFEFRQEHKKKNCESCFFPSQKCCVDSLSVCPATPRVYIIIRSHKNDHSTHVKDPVVLCRSSVNYGNTKRPSMRFTVRRITVLLQSKVNSRV